MVSTSSFLACSLTFRSSRFPPPDRVDYIPSLRLPLIYLIHIRHPLPHQIRYKLPNSLLIDLIVGILLRRDQFREPRARLKEEQVRHGPDAGPIVVRFRNVAGPGVQRHPDGLLGEEIRVPRQGPEALGQEAAVEVAGGEAGAGGELGGGLVGFLRGLEVCCVAARLAGCG